LQLAAGNIPAADSAYTSPATPASRPSNAALTVRYGARAARLSYGDLVVFADAPRLDGRREDVEVCGVTSQAAHYLAQQLVLPCDGDRVIYRHVSDRPEVREQACDAYRIAACKAYRSGRPPAARGVREADQNQLAAIATHRFGSG